MKNMLFKEFRLGIHPLYLVFPVVLGALEFIPQWFFMLVPLYFCFVSVPNLFGQYRANNDIAFSTILPVTRKQIARSRIISFSMLELLHVFWILVFAIVHNGIYPPANYGLDLNAAYFGAVFVMFGILNLILFPIHYRTAYKYGVAAIIAIVAAVLFAAAAETSVMFLPRVRDFMEVRQDTQWLTLTAGILFFTAANLLASAISTRSFVKIDL